MADTDGIDLLNLLLAQKERLENIRDNAVDMLVMGDYSGATKSMTINDLVEYLLSLIDLQLAIIARANDHVHATDKLTVFPAPKTQFGNTVYASDNLQVVLPEQIKVVINEYSTATEHVRAADSLKVILEERVQASDGINVHVPKVLKVAVSETVTAIENIDPILETSF